MESQNTIFVMHWIERMSLKHGGIVVDENGKRLDWGQALCRERYGEDWTKNLPDEPDNEAVLIAKKWETGYTPQWVDRYI